MFKNAIIYRIGHEKPWPGPAEIESALALFGFAPTAPTQQCSSGVVPPRGHAGGALAECVGNELILRLCTETRGVPSAELNRQLDARCKALEEQAGRKPGKKQRRELKEDITLELLPRAFPKRSHAWIWIDRANDLLVVDAGSARAAEGAAAMVTQLLGEGFTMQLLQTATSPEFAMGHWVVDRDAPPPFELGRECELTRDDETKATVKFKNYAVEAEEVSERVRDGMAPTKVALGWKGRLFFTLTDALAIKRISMDDSLFATDGGDKAPDGFDADVAIFTGEMKLMLPDLVEALGGHLVTE